MSAKKSEGGTPSRQSARRRRYEKLCRQYLLYRHLARAHAVGDANSTIGIARQSQTWPFLQEIVDPLQPIQVANRILGHRTLPAIDASEEWLRFQSNDLAKFLSHDTQDLIMCKLQHLLVAAAAKKAAQQCPIFRSAMRELGVHESCRQHALAFPARDQKPEAWRQTGSHFLVETQRNRH